MCVDIGKPFATTGDELVWVPVVYVNNILMNDQGSKRARYELGSFCPGRMAVKSSHPKPLGTNYESIMDADRK